MGFRPNKSLSFPKIGVVTAIVSKYAVKIQLSKFTLPSSLTIVGPAGPITVPSIAARKVANRIPVSTSPRFIGLSFPKQITNPFLVQTVLYLCSFPSQMDDYPHC